METADRTTKLGDDLTVSAIGFGAAPLTSVYGDVDDAESLATLNRCLDLGVTFIDTANVYGSGNNERLIAKLLADRRDEVTLATNSASSATPLTAQPASSTLAAMPPTFVRASTRACSDCRPTWSTSTTCTDATTTYPSRRPS